MEGSDEEPDAFGRPVSPHPNFVTAEGLRFIELELARAQDRAVKAAASGDRVGAARGEAEVVYWVTRRGTAQVAIRLQLFNQRHGGVTMVVQ